VVVDEAHHATAETYVRILEHVRSFEDDGPLTVGVTATPERADGTPLAEVFQEVVFRKDILSMMQAGFLADLRALRVFIAADLNGIHTRAGDLVPGELESALRAAGAPKHAAEAYTTHARGRKAIVFTPGVALAHEMAAAFRAVGVPAEALDGESAVDDRRATLARFHAGRTLVVCNCAVLTEGFDEPSVDCIIIARPTKSRPLYTQMIGRGTRTWPGKRDTLILDLVGSTARHDLLSAATLFGLSPRELADSTVTAAVRARQAAQLEHEAAGRLAAQTVDLFRNHRLHWVSTNAARHALSLGDGVIVLASNDQARWRVVRIDRRGAHEVIAEGLDLGFAQGVAEDYARRAGAGVLVSRTANWRRTPASEGQVAALRKFGIPVRPGITKGEASDLITAAVAGRVA
jgi:superfamily II DNA or RNA helicase